MSQEQTQTALQVNTEVPAIYDLADVNVMECLHKSANTICKSDLIPQHYRMNPGNTFIALYRAKRLNIDPFAFMEQTFVVSGKLGYQGEFVIAVINNSGRFTTPLQWEFGIDGQVEYLGKKYPNRWGECYATLAATGKKVNSMRISCSVAMENGWHIGKSDRDKVKMQWLTLPDLRIQYRTASYLGRTYCPDLLMGMRTKDEIQDAEVVNDTEPRGAMFTRKTEPTEQQPVVKTAEAEVVDEGQTSIPLPAESAKEEPVQEEPVQEEQPTLVEAVGAAEEAIDEMTDVTGDDLAVNRPDPHWHTQSKMEWLKIHFKEQTRQVESYLRSIKFIAGEEGLPHVDNGRIDYIVENWDNFLKTYGAFIRKQDEVQK